jgi:3-oxoacyl-[acyl-carrier protein] reductase
METSCLKNKNCLITGATGGIGKEVSIQLADQSCNLFLTGRNKKKLESLKKLLIKNNPDINIEYKEGDLTRLSGIKNIVTNAKHHFGNIDILINCAGIFMIKSIGKSTVEDFDKSINLNVRAPFILSREFSKDMVSKKWGRIVLIGSSSSYSGFENGSVYCASKHSILGLSRALNIELKKKNVRVMCISPSSTKTNMGKISVDQDFNTFLNPKEVAEYIIFILSFDNEMSIDESRLNRMIMK